MNLKMYQLFTTLVAVMIIPLTTNADLPDNFHLTKLENGLEVLVIEDATVPLATIEICVKNGAFTESPEYDGLSHLYEHMFFKANKDIPSQEKFMDRINELGIIFNGTTSSERVNYYITMSNQKLEEGMRFMNSAIRYPLFLEEEMKKENPVVDGEFQRNESNPAFFLQDDLAKQLWGENYSRKNTIGDHDIILSATPEKMRVIKDKYYHPDNSILVVAGDVDHESVFKFAEEIYSDWAPAGFDPFEKYPVPEFKPLQEDKFFITVNENARVPIIAIGLHGPDTRNALKATYAADVFSFILGQASSKLQKELVDTGLALQVSVGYYTNKYTGPIYIYLVPHPTKVREAITALYEHIDQWDNDDYFTDQQLETAKRILAIEDTYDRESTSEFVHSVTFWWAVASIDYYTNYVKNLNQVSREDIKNFVRTYIKDQPRVTGILVSPEMKTQLGITDSELLLKR